MERSKGFSELNKSQQLNRVKTFMKSETNTLKAKRKSVNILLKKPTSISGSPSIIRIVPNMTKTIKPEKTAMVQAYGVQNCKSKELTNRASSSNTQLQDHTYLAKSERTIEKNENDSSLLQKVDSIETPSNNLVEESIELEEPELITSTRIDNNVSTVSQNLNKVHSDDCCCACRETLNIILRQQQEILSYLKSGQVFEKEIKYDLLPPMPFNDVNDFLDFDESLCNENVQSQFISKMKKLLVSTEQKSVSNIMSSILTNELSKDISWIGIKDTLAFGNTTMVGLIVELIQDHHEIDIDVVKSRVAEWLRRCGDRISNEMKKSERKAKRLFI